LLDIGLKNFGARSLANLRKISPVSPVSYVSVLFSSMASILVPADVIGSGFVNIACMIMIGADSN
jgi:hypothetical protein